MSSSDDEELQRAIAMSLEEQPDGTSPNQAIPDVNMGEAPPATSTDATTNPTQPLNTRVINNGLKQLDRKQLEAFSASASTLSSQHDERPSKKARTVANTSSQESEVIDLTSPRAPKISGHLNSTSVPTPPGLQTLPSVLGNAHHTTHKVPTPRQFGSLSTASSSRRVTEPQYLDGAIKRTWAYGCPRDNDIKIEEVLQGADLNSLLVSTWNFNTEWWKEKIDLEATKQTWIIGAVNEEQKNEWALAPRLYENVSVCFPPMPGGSGIYHAKFLIGAHPKYLRIAITTANLNEHDWGESGLMENTVFLIDLPRLPDGQTIPENRLTPFGTELQYYLRCVGCGPNLCKSLLKFDWSRTNHLAFVHSIGGPNVGSEAQRTGTPGLSNAIRELGQESTTLEIDYATSSLGALSRAFMKQLLVAAKGEEVKVTKEKYDSDVKVGDLLNRFRVYFPTANTVKNSKGGPDGGGTIFLAKKLYDAASFPKACMHDHQSTRNGVLSHNKIILGRGLHVGPDEEDEGATQIKHVAWAYIGSANLTQAAWGTLTTDRATKGLKVTCRNYECGVVVAMPTQRLGDRLEIDAVPGYDAFKGTVGIPFEIPGERYGDKMPWIMR